MLTERQEEIAAMIVHAAFKVHRAMGPGLLEKIYEACLEYELKKSGLKVIRQLEIPIYYDELVFDEGLRLDLLVEDEIIIELKAAEQINSIWEAQIISYLKMMKLQLGFLINFNVPLIKQGIHRYRV
jgi:GxxExxY protein